MDTILENGEGDLPMTECPGSVCDAGIVRQALSGASTEICENRKFALFEASGLSF